MAHAPVRGGILPRPSQGICFLPVCCQGGHGRLTRAPANPSFVPAAGDGLTEGALRRARGCTSATLCAMASASRWATRRVRRCSATGVTARSARSDERHRERAQTAVASMP